jgi:hypothetical protein
LQDNDFGGQVLAAENAVCTVVANERLSGVIFSQIANEQSNQLNLALQNTIEETQLQKKNAIAGAKKSGASQKEIKKIINQWEKIEKESVDKAKNSHNIIVDSTKKMAKPEMSAGQIATLALVSEKFPNTKILKDFCIDYYNLKVLCNQVFQPIISNYESPNHAELIKKMEIAIHEKRMKEDSGYNSLAKLVGGNSSKVVQECTKVRESFCSSALPESFRTKEVDGCKKYPSTYVIKALQNL